MTSPSLTKGDMLQPLARKRKALSLARTEISRSVREAPERGSSPRSRVSAVTVIVPPSDRSHDHPPRDELADEAEDVPLDRLRRGVELGGQLVGDLPQRPGPVEPAPDGLARLVQGVELILDVPDVGDERDDDDLALELPGHNVLGRGVGGIEMDFFRHDDPPFCHWAHSRIGRRPPRPAPSARAILCSQPATFQAFSPSANKPSPTAWACV